MKLNSGKFFKIKVKNIPTNIMFFAMFILDGFHYVAPNAGYHSDYMNYYNMYYGIAIDNTEWGYRFVTFLARNLGMNFITFRLIFVTITLLLLRDSILKYSKEPGWVTLIFMIYPFGYQCEVMREAFSAALVIYSLRFLDKENLKIWRFLLCIAIGSLFHISTLLYAVFAIIPYIDEKRLIKISAFILLTVELVIYFFRKSLVEIVANILHISKIALYLRTDDKGLFTITMLVYLVLYLVCVYVYVRMFNEKKDGNLDKVMLLSSVMLFTLIPLILIDHDYFRVFDFFFPVVTTGIFNVLHGHNFIRWIYKVIIRLGFLAIVFNRCIAYIDNYEMFNLIKNNLLFK